MIRRLAAWLNSGPCRDWLFGAGLALDPCPRSSSAFIFGRSVGDVFRTDSLRLHNDSRAWMSSADRHWPTPIMGKPHGERTGGAGRVDGLAAE